jgi:hypothetical protein
MWNDSSLVQNLRLVTNNNKLCRNSSVGIATRYSRQNVRLGYEFFFAMYKGKYKQASKNVVIIMSHYQVEMKTCQLQNVHT